MLDPIHWSLGYSQLWPAYSQNQAKLNKLCETSPDDGRSDLDGLVKYWPNRSGPKASRCARISRSSSGRTQLTCYQFPTFRLICVLLQTAQIILCSIWSRSKRESKNHRACFRPTFPSQSSKNHRACFRPTFPSQSSKNHRACFRPTFPSQSSKNHRACFRPTFPSQSSKNHRACFRPTFPSQSSKNHRACFHPTFPSQSSKNHRACFRPTFPSQSRSDVNQIQHIYWVSCWSVLYSTILHSWAASLVFSFLLLNIHCNGVLIALTQQVPHETAAISAHSVYTIQPCHFMQSHICKVRVCLAVTCHLHFWQNDRDLLGAAAVTEGRTDTKIRVSTESQTRRRKFSHHTSRTWTHKLSITSPAL